MAILNVTASSDSMSFLALRVTRHDIHPTFPVLAEEDADQLARPRMRRRVDTEGI